MHSRASTPPSGAMAPVGQASMHRRQVPQRSGGGAHCASPSIGIETSNSPRKYHDPVPWWIRHAFLPIQPRPAARA